MEVHKNGTLYPALVKLEQEGHVSAEWGTSNNNRRDAQECRRRRGIQMLDGRSEWHNSIELPETAPTYLHIKRFG